MPNVIERAVIFMRSIDLPSRPSRYLSLLCALLLALVGHHASAQTNQLAAGAEHTCAVTASGSVKCWGNNATGQLGNGSFSSSPLPTLVLGFDVQVRAVAAGAGHSCALTVIGSVKCWGNNGWGQLGNNSTDASSNTLQIFEIFLPTKVWLSGFQSQHPIRPKTMELGNG